MAFETIVNWIVIVGSAALSGVVVSWLATYSEIIEATGLSQSNVSNHLSCLRDCGLVVAEQAGRYVTYHLSDDRVGELIAIAEALLADVARGVYECTRYNISRTESRRKR